MPLFSQFKPQLIKSFLLASIVVGVMNCFYIFAFAFGWCEPYYSFVIGPIDKVWTISSVIASILLLRRSNLRLAMSPLSYLIAISVMLTIGPFLSTAPDGPVFGVQQPDPFAWSYLVVSLLYVALNLYLLVQKTNRNST
jgi:hypothetical protein